ncbi:hypothetical protein LJK88_25140 [Paenibacillus sp. P26]|nr:hypothetical protein LJK88_25140 [Paenibacillus sp. P26]
MIKALIRLGYSSRKLGWTVVTFQTQAVTRLDPVNPLHASLHGLAGSMAKEYPNWSTRIIDLEASGDWPADAMLALPADRRGQPWAYRNGEWYRRR